MDLERNIPAFELGQTVMTIGISAAIEQDPNFRNEIEEALGRYKKCDWGDLDPDDAAMNDAALDPDTPDRILAAYQTSHDKIWIITEWDRSATTILFPDEY